MTPLLGEIDRIRGECHKHRFKEPENFEQPKIDDFNDLLEQQLDVGVTHSTFLNATPETIDYIRQGNYIAIIDEALDVLAEFNKINLVRCDEKQAVTEKELPMLLDGHFIEISDTGAIKWIGGHYDGKFEVFERLARLNRVYWVRDKLMVCIFPPEIFSTFSKVYVMSYVIEGSPIMPYFDLFHIEYEKKTVVRQLSGNYILADWTLDSDAFLFVIIQSGQRGGIKFAD